jgi:hypothetical protein
MYTIYEARWASAGIAGVSALVRRAATLEKGASAEYCLRV